MRAEEQLKLAYMTIAELKDQNAKLADAVAALERRLAESDGRDRRMVEEFYRGMIEDMLHFEDSTKLLKSEENLKDSTWVENLCSDGKLEQAIARAEKNITSALESGTLEKQSYSFVYKVFKISFVKENSSIRK